MCAWLVESNCELQLRCTPVSCMCALAIAGCPERVYRPCVDLGMQLLPRMQNRHMPQLLVKYGWPVSFVFSFAL